MNKQNLNNELFEVMIRNAVLEQFSREYEDMLARSEKVSMQDYSVEFKKAMQHLYRKEKLQILNRQFVKISKRVAIIMLVLLTMTIVLFTTVEAFRTKVYNLFFNFEDSYSAIDLVAGEININDIIPDDWNGAYVVAHLPEGYEMESATYKSSYLVLKYIYKDKYIILQQRMIDEATQTVNSDNVETIDINGANGQIFFNKECYTLFWNQDNVQFILISNEKRGLVVNTAKNLKYIKKL